MATQPKRGPGGGTINFTGDPVPLDSGAFVNTSFVVPPPAEQPTKEPSRTWAAAANDTVIEGANAVVGGVKAIGDFIVPGNRVSAALGDFIERGGQSQSDVVKAEKAQFRNRVAAAEGIGDELAAVGQYVARNPVLTAAQAAGSFFAPGAAIKGANIAARTIGLGAGGVARAGQAAGVAAGGALAGGDAAGSAYELVMQTPLETLMRHPDAQALAQGGADEARIREALATAAARDASIIPALVGGAGGAFGAERIFAGGARSAGARGALKVGASEAAQEGLEEGVTQFEGQRAAAAYNPEIQPGRGVAAAAGMGAIMGGATGAAVNMLAPEPKGPLSRAAAVAAPMLALPAPTVTVDAAGTAQTADQRQQQRETAEPFADATPVPETPAPTNTLPAALIQQGIGTDPVQQALQVRRDEEATQQNLDNWMKRAEPLALDRAQAIRARGEEQGHDLVVVPHGAGQGFTVVPSIWVAQGLRGTVPQGEKTGLLPMDNTPTGVLRVDPAGAVTAETRLDTVNAGQAAQEQAAEAQRKAELGLTPDIEAVQAGVKRQPADITLANGRPFKTRGAALRAQRKAARGRVVEVQDGWIVRVAEEPSSHVIDVSAREVPQLEHDTSATGVLRADAAGAVTPETQAQRIDSAQAVAAQSAERERKAELGLTPDVERAQAGLPPVARPTVQPGDITAPSGPFKMKRPAMLAQKRAPGSELVQVQGGWVVRPKATQEVTDVGNADEAGAVAPGVGGQLGGDLAAGGGAANPAGVDAGGGMVRPAAAPAAAGADGQPVRSDAGEQPAAVAAADSIADAASAPRDDGAPAEAVKFSRTVKGDEIAADGVPLAELRKAARTWGDTHLAGQSFKNKASGMDIQVTRGGLKHGLHNAFDEEMRILPALPALLEDGKYLGFEAETRGRADVKGVHRLEGTVELDGKERTVGVVVRELLDGSRYYDHFVHKKQAPDGAGAGSTGGTSGATSKTLGDRPSPDDKGSVSAFRRTEVADAAAAALDRKQEALQQLADAIAMKWTNPPEVIVVRDLQDPRVPAAARDDDATQKSQGSVGQVAGFYYSPDRSVFLVADEIGSPLEAVTVLAHEALGHYGLRGTFGDRLLPILKQLSAMRRKEVLAKAQAYGLDPKKPGDLLDAAEEVLAEMAQKTPELGYVRRVIAAIRTFLRDLGLKKLALSDDEIIRSFILPAREWVVKGRDGQKVGQDSPRQTAFSRGQQAEVTGARGAGEQLSLFGTATQRLSEGLKNMTVNDVKQRAGNSLKDYRGIALALLGRRQLVDIYGADLPQLEKYSKLAQQMDADKNDAGAQADAIATAWGKLKDERRLAELMHDATLAQIDPGKPFAAGDNKVQWARLKQRFDALSPAAKDVYSRARNTYEEHYAQVREAIRGRIERSELASESKSAMLARMDEDFFSKIKGVYFPLARFGQYVVVVKDAKGKTANVSRAETLNEAEATRALLRDAYPSRDGFVIGKVTKSADFNAAKDGAGRGFMTDLFALLDKEDVGEHLQDAVNQLYLSSLPDLSWAKHGIHRKGTPGFSQDARRAFAQNVFHGARYLAKLRYADQLQTQLEDMQKHVDANAQKDGFDAVAAQHVVDEMAERHNALMNPKTNALSTALTSLGFIFHLGLSPASAMVNLSQTALVAYPVMGAKWGFDNAAAALLKASKEAAGNRNDMARILRGDEKAAFDAAVAAGTIDVTMAHDLAGISQGEDSKVTWKMRPVMKAASFLFHHAERFNRQVTFMAAYRLARDAGATHDAAYEQATQATYDGHFDYGQSNRPRAMQGPAAKVVLLFKQYAQNMVYTLSRQAYLSMQGLTPQERSQARRALSGLLVTHALGAGVLGLPVVGTLLAAASWLGSEDDEPWDAEVALRNVLADAIGQKPAEVLARGLSRLTPWDVSGRVGLDKLIFPDVQEGLEGKRLAESFMTGALGPVAGIGVNALKGLQDISEGHWLRGLESMMPTVLRGPMKAARYESEGAVDKSGVVIKEDVSLAAIAGQALGFSPSEVRNASEGRGAVFQHDRRLQQRRQALMRQYATAIVAGDAEGAKETRDDIAQFNQKNPDRRILPVNLRQSVSNRRRRVEEAEQGVYLPKNRADARRAGRFAQVDEAAEPS